VASLGDVIDDARRRTFVGRRRELRALHRAVRETNAPRVLFVHGAGGLGKTTLLHEMQAVARDSGLSTTFVDGRDLDSTPAGFRDAIGSADAAVLLIDEYDHLRPIDTWLRTRFMPELPAERIVILAGRQPPALGWRTEPGFASLVATLALDHLDHVDSAELLTRAGVAGADQPNLLRLGRGHPLALALLADVSRAGAPPARIGDVPDLVAALVDSLWTETLSDEHIAALATCTIAALTTEDLLRATVGPAAPRMWAWLRDRPFVVSHPRGLAPHELTRDALDSEFERRIPDRYRELHQAIHNLMLDRIQTADGMDRRRLAEQLLYLHRRSPLTQSIQQLRASGDAVVVPAVAEEFDWIAQTVRRAYGPDSGDLARQWFAEMPDNLSVVRTDDGVVGYAYHLFCPTGTDVEERDAVVTAIADHVARTGPTRPGETVNIVRFIGGLDGQRDPYAVLAGSVTSIIEWWTRPLAWSFVVFTDVAFWAPFFDYLGFQPIGEVSVGGLRHIIYGNDWRRFPVDAWMEMMQVREQEGGVGPPPVSLLRPPPLDQTAFRDAVRVALHHLNRADRLTGSPLIGSRLGTTAAEVRRTLIAAIDDLTDAPKGDRLRSVLDRTFVHAAASQEAAAEACGLPFSTYRRYLGRGVDLVTESLWLRETTTPGS
jgi:hypothetical protein